MAETKIEWTASRLPDGAMSPGYTFNSWLGCTKVSPACDHCYAEGWAKRSGLVQWGNTPRRRTSESYWKEPLKWNREAERSGVRRKVFCASLADVFDNQVPIEWRVDLWRLIENTPSLDWLLLTKRPQNIAKMLPNPQAGTKPWGDGWPNVWLGTTTENQVEADRRIPHLLSVPAQVHFLSCEPLLSSLDIRWALGSRLDVASGFLKRGHFSPGLETLRPINWVIAGGESGPGARPTHPDWFRSLRDQCAAAGVPFFFKQVGDWASQGLDEDRPEFLRLRQGDRAYVFSDGQQLGRVGKKAAGALLDGVAHKEFPHD